MTNGHHQVSVVDHQFFKKKLGGFGKMLSITKLAQSFLKNWLSTTLIWRSITLNPNTKIVIKACVVFTHINFQKKNFGKHLAMY
jgi:hypothetical protein